MLSSEVRIILLGHLPLLIKLMGTALDDETCCFL